MPRYAFPFQSSRSEELDQRICPPLCKHNLRRQSSFLSEGDSIAGAPAPGQGIETEVPKSRKHRNTTQKDSLTTLNEQATLF